jgi:hypothetical protein
MMIICCIGVEPQPIAQNGNATPVLPQTQQPYGLMPGK